MSYLLITRLNLNSALCSLRGAKAVRSLFRNERGSRDRMTQRVSQNKTYVAVNVPLPKEEGAKSKFWGVFRRNSSSGRKEPGAKSDYARLFSLAKPEKWNLLGIVAFWPFTTILNKILQVLSFYCSYQAQ